MVGTIVLARLLTPDQFGLVAMVSSIYIFFMMFRNLGLNEAIIQTPDITHERISTLFWINLAFSLGLTLIVMILAPIIAWFYDEPKLKSITFALSFVFVLGGLSTQHLALLKRKMGFLSISAIEIIASIVSVAVAIVLAWKGWGYWALVIKQLVLALATVIGAWILCGWRPGLPAYRTGVRPMVRFGMSNLGTYTVNYFWQNFDKILIGWRNGAQSLGYYDKAYHLFMAPAQQLTWPLGNVAVATLSRLNNDPERYRRYYLYAVSMLAFVGMPLSAILTIMSDDIILLLLGPQWNKTAEIFFIFGLGIGPILIYGTQGWLHLSLGRPDRWLLWSIINSVVSVISFVIGLQFGPLGVAAAYIISLYAMIGPCLWYAGRPINLKLSSIVSVIWKCFICAIIAGLLSWHILYSFDFTSTVFAKLGIYLRIPISIALCSTIYLLLIIAFYQSVEPISQFVTLIRNIVQPKLHK